MPSLTQHDIDVAHLETVRQFVFQNETLQDHVSFKLLIGGKHCNSKKRQSWALNRTETETNSKLLVKFNECQEFSEDVERMVTQYIQVLTILTEIWSNFFDLPRTGLWMFIMLFLLVCGSSQVAHGLCEVPSMKVLTRGMMKEHWWGSIHDLSQLLAFYTLLRWPQTPCHQAHTCPCACHVLLSFDLGGCVDPVRFSLIARSPMVQILLWSNLRLAKQWRCTLADVSFPAAQQGKHCFWPSPLCIKMDFAIRRD